MTNSLADLPWITDRSATEADAFEDNVQVFWNAETGTRYVSIRNWKCADPASNSRVIGWLHLPDWRPPAPEPITLADKLIKALRDHQLHVSDAYVGIIKLFFEARNLNNPAPKIDPKSPLAAEILIRALAAIDSPLNEKQVHAVRHFVGEHGPRISITDSEAIDAEARRLADACRETDKDADKKETLAEALEKECIFLNFFPGASARVIDVFREWLLPKEATTLLSGQVERERLRKVLIQQASIANQS